MDLSNPIVLGIAVSLLIGILNFVSQWQSSHAVENKNDADAAESISNAAMSLIKPYQDEVARLLLEIALVKKASNDQIMHLTVIVTDLQQKEALQASQWAELKKENAWLKRVLNEHGIEVPPIPANWKN